MAGIALGQVIAYSGCALFLLWYLTSGPARVPIIFSNATLRWDSLRDILKVGAVASISPVQSILSALILTRVVSSFGTETLAGFGIGARLEFLLIPLAFGVGVTCVSMDLLGRILRQIGMLSHLRSCERYDEPETLPSSIRLICPTSADGGQLLRKNRENNPVQSRRLITL
jgi:hypothetical protein